MNREDMSKTIVLKNENVEMYDILSEFDFYELMKKYESKDIVKKIIDIKILEYISYYINSNSLTFLIEYKADQQIFTDINSLNDVLSIKYNDYTLFHHTNNFDVDDVYRSVSNYFFVLVNVKSLKEELFEHYNLN